MAGSFSRNIPPQAQRSLASSIATYPCQRAHRLTSCKLLSLTNIQDEKNMKGLAFSLETQHCFGRETESCGRFLDYSLFILIDSSL